MWCHCINQTWLVSFEGPGTQYFKIKEIKISSIWAILFLRAYPRQKSLSKRNIRIFFCVPDSQLRQEEGHKIYDAYEEYVVWMCKDNLHKSIISLLRVANVAIYHTFLWQTFILHSLLCSSPFFQILMPIVIGRGTSLTVQHWQTRKLHFPLFFDQPLVLWTWL